MGRGDIEREEVTSRQLDESAATLETDDPQRRQQAEQRERERDKNYTEQKNRYHVRANGEGYYTL